MSAWTSQLGDAAPWRATSGILPSLRRAGRWTLRLGALTCVLAFEGLAASRSYLWAAPLAGVMLVVIAVDLPMVPFIGLTLFVRVLTDGSGSGNSHHTGSINLAGVIAIAFILVAIGVLIRRQRGAQPTLLAILWLCAWTAVALSTHGSSAETIREGVREASVVALGLLVYNERRVMTMPTVTRLIQFIGAVPALIALYQFATHKGMEVAGHIRSNGTFVHPNSAAVFFTIATTVSLWRFLDTGRRRSDALLTGLFAAALIATFSIDGLISMIVMLMAFGALRPGSVRAKLGAFAAAGLVVGAFLATPLGAERLANASSSNVTSAERGVPNSSLAWRFFKWESLLPEWERSPLIGQGLGTTVTSEATASNRLAGFVPHNEFLRYLVETGAIGLGILLWALSVLIRALKRRRRIPGVRDAGTLNAASLAITIIIGCLFNSLGDNALIDSTTGYAVALIVGAALNLPASLPARKAKLATAASA